VTGTHSADDVLAAKLVRWGWAAFLGGVSLAVVLGVIVGLVTAAPAGSLAGTYGAVLAVGVGVPGLAMVPVLMIANQHNLLTSRLVNLLVVALVVCGVLGLVWVNGSKASTFVVEGIGFGAYLTWWTVRTLRERPLLPSDPPDWSEPPRRRPTPGQLTWAITTTAVLIAGTAAILAVPDPLTFSYRWHSKTIADRFLPQARVLAGQAATSYDHQQAVWYQPTGNCYTGRSLPSIPDFGQIIKLCANPHGFSLDNAAGWSLAYNSSGDGVCARHLDGRWWESYGPEDLAQGAGDCPWGLNFVNISGP